MMCIFVWYICVWLWSVLLNWLCGMYVWSLSLPVQPCSIPVIFMCKIIISIHLFSTQIQMTVSPEIVGLCKSVLILVWNGGSKTVIEYFTLFCAKNLQFYEYILSFGLIQPDILQSSRVIFSMTNILKL